MLDVKSSTENKQQNTKNVKSQTEKSRYF